MDTRQRQLSQLLLGGALFGIVDHAWNGELLLVGPDILKDLALGVTITIVIFGVWALTPAVQAWHHLVSRGAVRK